MMDRHFTNISQIGGTPHMLHAECDSCDWSKISGSILELTHLCNEHEDWPKFWMEDDKDGNPCFWWINPYFNEKEKIANLWWPGHPVEATKEIEELFKRLQLTIKSKEPAV